MVRPFGVACSALTYAPVIAKIAPCRICPYIEKKCSSRVVMSWM